MIYAILREMRQQQIELRERRNAARCRRRCVEEIARISQDKPQDVVREKLLEEFRRQGVAPYPQPLLDNVVDTIRTDDVGEKDRLLGERKDMLRECVSSTVSTLKDLKHLFENQD
jgi:hypothetical protein